MGLITKGMGAILKHAKKAKPKKAKLKTVHKIKPGLYIKQFKKSKKHGLAQKLNVWANRESGKLFTQIGSGINVKFKKSGRPYVPKGEKSSMLTRAKGATKFVSPLVAAATAAAVHGTIKDKKK